MSDIVLSNGIRSNLLSLQITSDLFDRTQNRMTSGKAVASVLDDPISYFQATALSVRSADLKRLLDGMGLGIQTIETANSAIESITRLIDSATGNAQAALRVPTTTARVGSGSDRDYRPDPVTGVPPDILNVTGITITPAIPAAYTVGAGYPTPAPFTVVVPVALALRVPGDTTGRTAQSIANAINRDPGNLGPTVNGIVRPYVQAEVNAGGRLTIENVTGSTEPGPPGTLRVQTAGGTLTDLLGDISPPTVAATATDTGVIGASFNRMRFEFAGQYQLMIDQISNLAADASFNGTNLLKRQSLDIVFNDESATKMTVDGVQFDAEGLRITPQDVSFQFQSALEIERAIGVLRAARETLEAKATDLAGHLSIAKTRVEFTNQSMKSLLVGADELVLADLNEESAALLALQTRQDLSIQALSLAAQSEQAVLRLFG
jgi:flagellin